MPPKRKSKQVPPIGPSTYAGTPNSSNGTPSPRVQGHQSTQSPIPFSTPSTAQSSIHTTAQSSVDPTTVANTPEQTTSDGIYLILLLN